MVDLIYYTPDYHKLIEAVARVCYQSYDKVTPTSHKAVKGILQSGHLSIAGIGNMVFKLNKPTFPELVYQDLLKMKEINGYVRLTTPEFDSEGIILSMNILSLRDLINAKVQWSTLLLESIVEAACEVPELKWLLTFEGELEPSDNPYVKLPKGYNEAVLLTDDYVALKELGFTEHELGVHAAATVIFRTDRATGLQTWRHSAETGGCELSQRYVQFEDGMPVCYPEEMLSVPEEFKECAVDNSFGYNEAAYQHDVAKNEFERAYTKSFSAYTSLCGFLHEHGIKKGRAREIARFCLPNGTATTIIQCRPYRHWEHFFKLRADDNAAQKEIRILAKNIRDLLF